MKKIYTLLAATLFALSPAFAQHNHAPGGQYDHVGSHREGENINPCGNLQVKQKMFALNPEFEKSYKADRKSLNEWTEQWIANKKNRGGGGPYIIPTVFHVLHVGGVENISDDQIYSAMDVINEDFNLGNTNAANVAPYFQGWPTDSEIEFRLAQKKPNGDCFKGITRTYSQTTYDGAGGGWSNDQMQAVENAQGDFPGDEYLNIFVVAYADGAAGYTTTPSNWLGGSMFNGIILIHTYVGRIGTGNNTRSHALTHEIGHWLNLEHVWGPNNNPGNAGSCSDDDSVDDTPNTIGSTSCNLTANTCSNESPFFNGTNPIDNVENYMDYSYCYKMYTDGQRDRMHAALNSNTGGRSNLWTVSNLNATGTNGQPNLCAAEFEASNLVVCAGDTISFNDLSYHSPTGWTWTFTGGSPQSSTLEAPQVAYATPGTYDVTLQVTDGTSSQTITETAFITVLPATGNATPYSEGFETGATLPNNDWYINNPDGGITWNVTTATAYDGTHCLRLSNVSNSAGNLDGFESTSYDLSNLSNVYLSFQYAYVEKTQQDNESLKIYCSNDCGATWAIRKQVIGSAFPTDDPQSGSWTPSSQDDWKEVIVTNLDASYLVENFRFKFEFESDGGNNIYIDNINLGIAASIADNESQIGIFEVYPNPLENGSVVDFELVQESNVNVEIFNAVGQKVADVSEGRLSAGQHRYQLPTGELGAGFYFVKLSVGNQAYTKKVLVK